jgi:hypothetical protein
MFKILLISLITFMIVIIAFLILMSFLDVDIITHSKIIENFSEPTTTGDPIKDNDYFIFINNGSLRFDTRTTCEVLIVGGGGGGGRNDDWEGGGGGGAGGVGYGTITFDIGTYDITIGAGGAGGSGGQRALENGKNGGNTSVKGGLINETSHGGGGGGWRDGLSGGSGGGGSGHAGFRNKGGSTKGVSLSSLSKVYMTYYGNSGGDGHNPAGGGGGGGAGSQGLSNPSWNFNGGNGGDGKSFNYMGREIIIGAGGGGASGCRDSCPRNNEVIRGNGGNGGNGGGGRGGHRNDPTDGARHSGGGGGGSSQANAGNGGSGVVVIKYKNISNNIINQYYTDLKSLFTNKRPWGEYYAENFDGVYLNDTSGNKRHATISGNIESISNNGNGALANVSYIFGGTSSIISWPAGSIPPNFTILSLTRYNGGSRRRILSSDRSAGNFLHGHWGYDVNNGKGRGCVHYDEWKSIDEGRRPVLGNLDDWLCCIGKNGGSAPNNILFDGIPSGLVGGGVGGYTLGINNNRWGEYSDWALSCVIIWDRHLEDNEMLLLNKMIHEYKETGRTIIDIINNNASDNVGVSSLRTTTTTLSQNDQYDEDNRFYTYYPKWDSTFSLGYSTSIKKNDINYNYSDSEILTNFGTFIGNGSKKISITFENSFVLKKIIIIADSEILNAPSEWKINLGGNNVPLIGTATKEDYNAIQGKSANFCVKFYIDNLTPSNTYDIIFTKTLGGTQLNFSKIILFEGTKPPQPSTNPSLI